MHNIRTCAHRSQLTAAKADAHVQQQRLAAAEANAATTAAQLLEAQANLSKVTTEAQALQQESEARLATARLSCSACAEKSGQVLELQQQLAAVRGAGEEQQRGRQEAAAALEACRSELDSVKAALAVAQRARDHLYQQLHGGGGLVIGGDAGGAAGSELGGYGLYNHNATVGSPTRMQLQMQMVSAAGAEEGGLIQRCTNMALQLQQQDVELSSLRQQLVEQQLALSEAQTSCGSAERQLQQAAGELKSARAAAGEASAAASAARQEADAAVQQVKSLQQALAQQQPDLAATKARVQKLEAQQHVLLGEYVCGGVLAARELTVDTCTPACALVWPQWEAPYRYAAREP